MARLLALLLVALAFAPAVARADGDPASDILVFDNKKFFLPFAPEASASSKERIDAATKAAFAAGFPIKVAVIGGPGDLGAVPQMAGHPQQYADFLSQELQFAYKDTLLIVMPEGYGVAGTHNAAVKASVAPLQKPKSGDSTDLVNAAADAVKAVAAAGGVTIDVPAATSAAATEPASSSSSSGSSSILYVAGGTVVVVVLVVGLLVWVRRAPPAPRSS